MTLQMIWQRIRYYWRQNLVYLLALCLLCTLAAFLNTYTTHQIGQYIDDRIQTANPLDFQIIMRDSREDIDPSLANSLPDNLGDLYIEHQPIRRTVGVTCGITYPDPFRCFQIATYDDLESLVTLNNGELPQPLPTRDNDDLETPQIQAVAMAQAASRSHLEIGEIITFGPDRQNTLIIEMSGIVEPRENREDFWYTQVAETSGITTPVGIDYRNDTVLFIPPEAFEQYVVAFTEGNLIYRWFVALDPTIINAGNLSSIESRLLAFEQDFFQAHPGGSINNRLLTVIQQMQTDISTNLLPTQTMLLGIIALGLWLLFFTGLTFTRRTEQEWQTFEQYGASLQQTIRLQLMTYAAAAALAAILAVGITFIILQVLQTSNTLTGEVTRQPQTWLQSFGVSLLVAAIGLAGMALVLWIHFLSRANPDSSPTAHTFITTYAVDFGLIALGIFLLLRLYFVNADNLSESFQALFTDPLIVINTLRAQSGLSDPLDLFAPLLLIAGLGLLFLRMLPLLHRLISSSLTMFGLPATLAGYNLRAPHRYGIAFDIILLTVILAMTAAILNHTHITTLRNFSTDQTGGDARVTFPDATRNLPALINDIPDITSGTSVLRISEANPVPLSLLIAEQSQLTQMFPQLSEITASLYTDTPQQNGIILPSQTQTLSFYVYATNEDDIESQTLMRLYLTDAIGISTTVDLPIEGEFSGSNFVELSVELPSPRATPWRLIQLGFVSNSEAEFTSYTQEIFLDTITAYTSNESIIVEDFERNLLPEWDLEERQARNLTAVRLTSRQHEGDASLRIGYRVNNDESSVIPLNFVPINTVREQPIPIIISSALAEHWGDTLNNRNPLTAGYQDEITLPLTMGGAQITFTVVDIITQFPTMQSDDNYFIAPTVQMHPIINQRSNADDFLYWNELWLETPSTNLENTLSDANINYESIIYASDTYAQLIRAPLETMFLTMIQIGTLVILGLATISLCSTWIQQPETTTESTLLMTLGISPSHLRWQILIQSGIPLLLGIIAAIPLGIILAALILPFLSQLQSDSIIVPYPQLISTASALFVLLLIARISLFSINVSPHQENPR